MPVAILKPFRRGNDLLMRGVIGNDPAGSVSVFYPFRIGTSMVWRGKDCDGKVLYAWPFRRGNDLLARTIYRTCGGTGGDPVPAVCGCTVGLLPSRVRITVAGWVMTTFGTGYNVNACNGTYDCEYTATEACAGYGGGDKCGGFPCEKIPLTFRQPCASWVTPADPITGKNGRVCLFLEANNIITISAIAYVSPPDCTQQPQAADACGGLVSGYRTNILNPCPNSSPMNFNVMNNLSPAFNPSFCSNNLCTCGSILVTAL